MDTAVKVTCRGAGLAGLKRLTPFQGDLKSLSEANYQKLKKSILGHGISFPFFVWKSGKTLYTLDGHQRDRALRRMEEEGFRIPEVPIDFIQARDEKEAKAKILLLSSQYGTMTEDSLYQFLKEASLDFEALKEIIDLPQIDLAWFEKAYLEEPSLREYDETCADEVKLVQCPKCGHEFPA